MAYILMPRAGLTQEEGTITEWKVKEGEAFVAGQVLAEMTSDKSTVEVTAEYAGKLAKILIAEDESCKVGEPIAEYDAT